MSEKNLNYIWGIGFFIVGPLIMTQGYSNITVTKFTTYGLITIICFFWILLLRYFDYAAAGGKTLEYKRALSILGGYFIANIISCIISGNMVADIISAEDKHMGLFYAMLTIMLFLTVLFTKIFDADKIIRIAAAGTIILILFAMLQFMGLDFGSLLGRLASEERGNFLSTMGNTAVFGKYCCVVCPVMIYMLWSSDKAFDKCLCRLLCTLYFIAVVISNIDAAFLGWGIGIAALALMALRQKKIKNFLEMLECGIIGLFLFSILYKVISGARHLSEFGQHVVAAVWYELAIGILIAVIMFGLHSANWNLNNKISKVIFYIIVICLVITAGLVIVLFVYFSIVNRECELGKFERYLRFSDDWGTQRGIVWKWCANIYSELPLSSKLFGAGHGSVPRLLMENYKNDMLNSLGFYFDNAHNVYLHQLISIGAVGVVSYIAIIIVSIVNGFKCEETAIFSVGIIIFCVMDMVCIYEPITNPYLWILMALAMRKEIWQKR